MTGNHFWHQDHSAASLMTSEGGRAGGCGLHLRRWGRGSAIQRGGVATGCEVNEVHRCEARWPAEMDTVRVAVSQWEGSGESGQSGAHPPELRAPSGLCVVLLVGYNGRKRSKEFPTRSPKHREPEEVPLPEGVQIDIHVSLLMCFLGLRLSGEGRRGRRAELPGAGSPQSARTQNKGIFLGGAC